MNFNFILQNIKNNKIYIYAILSFILVYVLLSTELIYLLVWQIKGPGNQILIFWDWNHVIDANLCFKKGQDVYINNVCDQLGVNFIYGKLMLFIPFLDYFENFYRNYLPLILTLTLILSIFKIINKNKNYTFFTLLLIFSPSTLLLIERSNIDLIIFLISIIIIFSKNLKLSFFLTILSSFFKFYPILLSLKFLFQEIKIKKKIILLFSISIIFSLYLFLNLRELDFILDYTSKYGANGIANFNLFSTLNYIQLKGLTYFSNLELIIFKLIIFIIFLSFSFLLTNYLKLDNLEITTLNKINFIVPTLFTLLIFILISNWIYREIFLIFSYPFILEFKNKNIHLKFIYYFIVSKYIANLILIFTVINFDLNRNLNGFLAVCKNFTDIVLMILLLSLSFSILNIKKISRKGF